MSMASVSTRTAKQTRARVQDPLHFYQEPKAVTEKLIDRAFGGVGRRHLVIHDPCCGEGNIPKTFQAAGFNQAWGSDIADRGYGVVHDFLSDGYPFEPPDWICTNPPYQDAQRVIDKALTICDRVAVFVRLSFLEGQKRRAWFEAGCLSRVLVCSSRVLCPPKAMISAVPQKEKPAGAIAYCWCLFDRNEACAPTLEWIP
ncbi:MAG TPA: hypothetical protein VN838_06815 [Bradyrhizobium sp.]|nr:hypothetical protein [Bradyrhizobium sp.]